MLLNDFYTIEKWSLSDTTAGEVRAVLALNAAHPVFAGHFPGQPVVPGACQLRMVEELLSHVLNVEYSLVNAGQIKFLTPIDPRRHPRIEAVLRYAVAGPFQVTATFSAVDPTFIDTTFTDPASPDPASANPASADPASPNPASANPASADPSAGSTTANEASPVAATPGTIFLKLSGIFRAA